MSTRDKPESTVRPDSHAADHPPGPGNPPGPEPNQEQRLAEVEEPPIAVHRPEGHTATDDRRESTEPGDQETPHQGEDDETANLIHALLYGQWFDTLEVPDYAFAAGFSHGVQAALGGGRRWLGSRIASFRASGLDPQAVFPKEITDDPILDQQAEFHARWPRALAELLLEGPVSHTPIQGIFLTLDRHFQTRLRADGFEHYECDPKHSPEVKESILRAIRATVCLFGQRGFDEILLFDEVQEILRSAPSSAFGESGDLANIHLPSSEENPRLTSPL